MATIKSFLGYLGAGFAAPLILVTFIGMEGWVQTIADTGVRISPWITGDAPAYTLPHDGYQTVVHQPVFMGLLWETRDGFVQVDWTPREKAPAAIDEEIDYDRDGRADFRVQWNTQTGEITLTPLSENVLYLEGKYELKESWAIRVRVKNPRR
ncbi:MAG: hypothetical protein WBM17_12765 [Anaerolineales bacterium]